MRNSRWLNLTEKFTRPFPAPRRFGWIPLWHDESNRSLVTAVFIVLLIVIAAVWFNRSSDTGRSGAATVTLEQVVLGESEDDLQLTDERTESIAVQQMPSQTSLSDGEVATPEVETPIGELQIETPVSSFDASAETQEIASTIQGLRESVRSLKGEPVVLAGDGGISGILKVGSDVESVVFVIDKSSSMSAERRLERVKAELIAAIDDLAEKQSFSVVFFDNAVWPMGYAPYLSGGSIPSALKMERATPKQKKDAKTWIQSIGPGGGTYPSPAAMLALTADPELIVILSDGEFDQASVGEIRETNHRKNLKMAQIDCIGIGEIVPTLQQIAKENKGFFRPAR